MEDNQVFNGVLIISLSLILWLIIFLVIRWSVNKKFISKKRIQPKTTNFHDDLFDELQVFFNIEESKGKLILTSNKIDDIITNGRIIIETQKSADQLLISITYQRKIKLLGYFIILVGIAFCYIGALVPILIVQDTKKNALSEIDKIFSIVKSI